MKTILVAAVLSLGMGGAALALADTDTATNNAGSYVKNSVITTKVKSKLAAKHMSTLTKIKVDTDSAGVVYLSGTAPTKDASDLAEMVAKDTDGVTSVHNKIVVNN